MRIITFNANGIRSAGRKGFFDWFGQQDCDVLCVQETKAQEHQLRVPDYLPAGYSAFFRDASTRKGYSGVAIYTRREPDEVRTALGRESFDEEGRYIEARYAGLSIVSLYMPSGTMGDTRQQFKYQAMDWFATILDQWLHSGRDYIVCGDWNIVRSRNDIKNWTSNQKQTGCLPPERAWLNGLIGDPFGDGTPAPAHGWVDSFRVAKPDAVEYTWWSQLARARENNVGWRIDYQLITPSLRDAVREAVITPQPRFSDHAPYRVDYDLPRVAALPNARKTVRPRKKAA